MSGPVVLSKQTADDLVEVARFFGIDLEWNRHLFRHAASRDPAGFAVVIGALAEACRQDSRFGMTGRVMAEFKQGGRKCR